MRKKMIPYICLLLVNLTFHSVFGVHSSNIHQIALKKSRKELTYRFNELKKIPQDFSSNFTSYYEKDYSQQNLIDADFSNSELTNINFQNTDLTGANFKNAFLENVDFKKAKLINIDLEGALFFRVDLRGAWLSETCQIPDYGHSHELFDFWRNASEQNKPLFQKLFNTRFDMIENLSNHELHLVNWEGLNLRNSIFFEAPLENINFTNTDFEGACLDRANLSHAILKNANLVDADLNNANLTNADLEGANLNEARLYKAQIGGIKLSETLRLPENCTDEQLIEISRTCTDINAKLLLTQIIQGKSIFLKFNYQNYTQSDFTKMCARFTNPNIKQSLNRIIIGREKYLNFD